MKRRIGIWTLGGFAVACAWVIFGMTYGQGENLGQWRAAAITAPATLIGRVMPLAIGSFIFLNAAAYALLGFTAELLLLRPIR